MNRNLTTEDGYNLVVGDDENNLGLPDAASKTVRVSADLVEIGVGAEFTGE